MANRIQAVTIVALLAILIGLPVSALGGDAKQPAKAAARQPEGQPAVKPATQLASRRSALPEKDPRRSAQITLVLDKEEHFLGENVLLHYRVRNRGKEQFQINIGGDGRTPVAKRALRFKVELVGPQGRKAEDPYPFPANFGGPCGEPTLEPEDEFWKGLQLMRYREPHRAGTYTIKVYHDLGWEQTKWPSYSSMRDCDIPKGPRNAPTVTATIRLVMPDEQQARRVAKAMLGLPDNPNNTWGTRGRPFADFELLRYPVYLPIVKELAQKGDARGLDAIGCMAFPEATEALLELTEHENPAIASKAEELLLWRTPHVFHASFGCNRHLIARSWRDDLKTRALKVGWRLLAKDDRESRIRGARFTKLLGGKDDLPAIVKVMDKLLVAYRDNATEQRAYLRPATVSESLTDAAAELIKRGAKPPKATDTPGQAAAFLVGLKSSKGFRPLGWQCTAEALLTHEIPFIRALALQNMPLPLSDAAVTARIKDEFPPVQGAACDLAGKSKSARFRQPLMDVLRTTPNEWLLRSGFRAAVACRADMDELLMILVSRLERRSNDRNMVLLGLMIDGAIEHKGGYGASRHDDWKSFLGDLQKAWLEFIDTNRQALRGGKRFKIGQPTLKREMFPPGFQFHRAGQSPWPD